MTWIFEIIKNNDPKTPPLGWNLGPNFPPHVGKSAKRNWQQFHPYIKKSMDKTSACLQTCAISCSVVHRLSLFSIFNLLSHTPPKCEQYLSNDKVSYSVRTIKDLKKPTHPYQKCSEASWGNNLLNTLSQKPSLHKIS